jgi:23S rRNA (adenine2503-C2)-methyltransferase
MNSWNNIEKFEGKNPNVSKYVFTKSDAVVESVLYRYPSYDERTVICCSTMSGCPMGCRFCGTGDYFVRNLTSFEIVEQVDYCLEQTGINPKTIKKLQIMVMSMGEPLLNRNLELAFRILYAKYPHAALLVSTVGPKTDYEWFMKLSEEIPTIGLQFSVHESTDEARDKLIPIKGKLNLKEINKKGLEWSRRTGRKPFFNYCAGKNNTSSDDASRLWVLFSPAFWCATVSVICERDKQGNHSNEKQVELAQVFSEKLINYGFDTRVFDPAGQDDIGGGCGQLWFVQDWMKKHPELAKKSVGYGKIVVHMPT